MPRVLALEWWTDSLFELVLERPSWDYRAGECTLLVHENQVDSRPYSFSSHPEQDQLRFLLRVVSPSGRRGFSQWIASRRPGDEVGVGSPFGLFSPGQGEHEVWMATGTGIAPFLSCLRGSISYRPRVYWGLRHRSEAKVAAHLARNSDLEILISRDDPPQRVSPALKGFPWEPHWEYFLCGNGEMISSNRSALLAGMVDSSRIHEERFFA